MIAGRPVAVGSSQTKGIESWRPVVNRACTKISRTDASRIMIMSVKPNGADDGFLASSQSLNFKSSQKNLKPSAAANNMNA